MPLRLHNTMTRRKEAFTPLDPSLVRLYVCGPTVYDRAHIGNARPVIVFDVLFRLLRHVYGADHVRYVRNITDVDDKILVRAAERGIGIDELTEATTREFHEDVAALGCLPPTVEPRATDHIPEMIAVIERLIASGHAYEAQGNVLFDVPSMPGYGSLSNRSQGEMIAGARVEVAPYKRGDTDFVLWKPAAAGEPGWPSPWGRGRPGWHVECSAMSWKHLGETFDIHGGGLDLIFPHHENEIAQSRCAFHTPFMAQIWMHNGFLQVEGQKMSKSLGNFVTIHDLLAQRSNDPHWGEIVRLNMLRTHYRQPIDWSQASLEKTQIIYAGIRNAVEGKQRGKAQASEVFLAKLEDDLNTPAAIMEMQQLASKSHLERRGGEAVGQLIACLDLLGLSMAIDRTVERVAPRLPLGLRRNFVDFEGYGEELKRDLLAAVAEVDAREAGLDVTSILDLVKARLAARAGKNWAEADRIRSELAALGVAIKDNKDGTTSWSVGREGAMR